MIVIDLEESVNKTYRLSAMLRFLLLFLDILLYSYALSTSKTQGQETVKENLKSDLLSSIANAPPNAPSSRKQTNEILSLVRELEQYCPTIDSDVLIESSGNWQLLWTAQDMVVDNGKADRLFGASRMFRSFINPLENQAYSNNPVGTGRANPFLPREIQDRMETLGLVSVDGNNNDFSVSTQAIDIRKQRVRNVVAFQLGKNFPLLLNVSGAKDSGALRGSVTVDVKFKPNLQDARRVDVKFERCKFSVNRVLPKPLDIPLGPLGPTGWLRTVFIDRSIRITRGHKGSVFVLLRTSSQAPS